MQDRGRQSCNFVCSAMYRLKVHILITDTTYSVKRHPDIPPICFKRLTPIVFLAMNIHNFS